jgi:hypothetical protein
MQHVWVFLRRLSVRTSRSNLATTAVESVKRGIDAAIYGGNANAPEANAVRFDSLADLLACFSRDLARGRAGQFWYWRQWQHLLKLPRGEALNRLFMEHLTFLPTITARLAQLGELATVWQSLDVRRVSVLQAELARVLGIPALTNLPLLGEEARGEVSQPPPPRFSERWAGLSRQLASHDPRLWLAATLIAMEWRPLLLRQEGGKLVQDIVNTLSLNRGDSPKDGKQTHQSHSDKGQESSEYAAMNMHETEVDTHARNEFPFSRSETRDEGMSATDILAVENSESSKRDSGLGTRTAVSEQDDRLRSIEDGSGHIIQPNEGEDIPLASFSKGMESREADSRTVFDKPEGANTLLEIDHESTSVSETAFPPAVASFHTNYGGLFYLINFFNRPETAALFEAYGGMELLPSGWHWLYLLGRELGLPDDGELGQYLLEQMDLAAEDKSRVLSSLPLKAPLLDLAKRLYGQQGVWNDDLIKVPARVEYTPSHIDVCFPDQAISLAIRLVGLDINPGWVPWLGRVVTFYYEPAIGGGA